MRTIGIDPGATGALVMLEDGNPIEWMEMPTMKIGSATRVNAAAVADFMGSSLCDHVYVEQVGAMPGQGVSSMFNFGHSVGTIMGVLGAMGIPCTLVTPQFWKREMGLIGTDKDAARSRAIQLWPTWKELHKKGKGQALSDAALIALAGSKNGIK
jgi:crossover junction endodeoxyribonuclease RuvC